MTVDAELGQGTKTCPYCAETIKTAAVCCRHCGLDLPMASTSAPSSYSPWRLVALITAGLAVLAAVTLTVLVVAGVAMPWQSSVASTTSASATSAAPPDSDVAAPATFGSVHEFVRSLGDVDWERSPTTGTVPGPTLVAVASSPIACNDITRVGGDCKGHGRIDVLMQNDDLTWRHVASLNFPGHGIALGSGNHRGVEVADGGVISTNQWPAFVAPLAVSPSLEESAVVGRLHGRWGLMKFDTGGQISQLSNVHAHGPTLIGYSESCVPDCADSVTELPYGWNSSRQLFVAVQPLAARSAAPASMLRALADDAGMGVPIDQLSVDVTYDPADDNWARLDLSGAPGVDMQGGMALAHKEFGHWEIVDLGSDGVGCEPDLGVPSSVLTALDLPCF